jgi:hypothetical protein
VFVVATSISLHYHPTILDRRTTVNPGPSKPPFFSVIDRLATSPDGADAIGSDPALSAAVGALTQAQRDALFSGDWGLIQRALVAEQAVPGAASPNAPPAAGANAGPWDLRQSGPWDLFKISARAAIVRTTITSA